MKSTNGERSERTDSNNQLVIKAQAIYGLLQQSFGTPEWRLPMDAMDELISTILSQNTNDRNRDIAFFALKEKFPDWEEVRKAELDDIVNLIRPAGLANQKGARIKTVLEQIKQERGDLSLEFLKSMPPAEAHAWLVRFKGVGLKTAAIVMQFSLGMPAFPVDTHVYRVSGRLGLRPEKMNVDTAHEHLATLFIPETYGPAHLNLIRLGREICLARKPSCEHCPLTMHCTYFQRFSR